MTAPLTLLPKRIEFLGLSLLLTFAMLVPRGVAQTFSTLYNFTGQLGGLPSGPGGDGLIFGPDGSLYGTSKYGGTSADGGTVFQLRPPVKRGPWTIKTLHEFAGGGDGIRPYAGVIQGKNGALYGMTESGGANHEGTIFELTPSAHGGKWKEAILHSFGPFVGSDGSYPLGWLTVDTKGTFYGTTYWGGPAGMGTVFELTPPDKTGGAWTETVLYAFTGANGDGAEPISGVTLGPNGALFGTTVAGGITDFACPYSCGTVFELTPPKTKGGEWTEEIVYSFTGMDGDEPFAGVIIGPNGVLYGTTYYGGSGTACYLSCGTLFQVAPASGGGWTETVLYNFVGLNGDGWYPMATLTIDGRGVLYGSTTFGGSSPKCGQIDHGQLNECGTEFKLTPPGGSAGAWTETILHNFTGSDGADSHGRLLIGKDGTLYGTASSDGPDSGGTAFRLVP